VVRHDPWVGHRRSIFWPTLGSSAYVLAVAVSAGVGFVGESTWPILLAALLALPASILALPGYYLAYGMLAWVPGASPSGSTGFASSGPGGSGPTYSVTGGPAAWFTATTDALGVLALTGAAILNVVVFRTRTARRQSATMGAPNGS
jgi:hypothetical protein